MRSHGPARFILAVAVVIGCAAAACGAASGAQVDLRFAIEHLEGEFDGFEKVKVSQIPIDLSFGGLSSRFSIRASYLQISRTGNVVMTADGPAVIGVGGPGRPQYQTSAAGSSASGLSDVLLQDETFFLRTGKGKTPALSLLLDYKWAVADETEGLGTGEYEWGAGLRYVQPLSVRWRLVASALRRFMEDPPGMIFQNRWITSLGLEALTTGSLIRIRVEHQPPILDEVPVYDQMGVPTGMFQESDDRVFGRFDWVTSKAGGGTFLLGLWGGLTDLTEEYGFALSWSTTAQ
jgi:hypothetical protein